MQRMESLPGFLLPDKVFVGGDVIQCRPLPCRSDAAKRTVTFFVAFSLRRLSSSALSSGTLQGPRPASQPSQRGAHVGPDVITAVINRTGTRALEWCA